MKLFSKSAKMFSKRSDTRQSDIDITAVNRVKNLMQLLLTGLRIWCDCWPCPRHSVFYFFLQCLLKIRACTVYIYSHERNICIFPSSMFLSIAVTRTHANLLVNLVNNSVTHRYWSCIRIFTSWRIIQPASKSILVRVLSLLLSKAIAFMYMCFRYTANSSWLCSI